MSGNKIRTISLEDVLELYKSALEETSVLVITDSEGQITFANTEYCSLSGYSPEELTRNGYSKIKSFSGEDDQFWTTIREGRTWIGKTLNSAKDGGSFILETTVFPFPAHPQTPFQYLFVSSRASGNHEPKISPNNHHEPKVSKDSLSLLLDYSKQILENEKDVPTRQKLQDIAGYISSLVEDRHAGFPKNQNSTSTIFLNSSSIEENENYLKVLIAEDVEMNQVVIRKQLENLRFCCDFAFDGLSVLNKLENSKYDLILMDMQMPVLDGLQTIKKIRNNVHSDFYDIPIIAITASITEDAMEFCLKAGADEYLPKPFDIRELNNKIYKIISKRNKSMEKKTGSSSYKEKESLINLDYLHQLSDGDKEFTITMIEYFIENTPGVIESMKQSYDQKDWKALRNIAHKFKPQLNFMGINSLLDDLEKLEQYSHNETHLEALPELIEKSESICQQAIEVLKTKLDQMQDE
jgi:PAS domain S-box-containing protein